MWDRAALSKRISRLTAVHDFPMISEPDRHGFHLMMTVAAVCERIAGAVVSTYGEAARRRP